MQEFAKLLLHILRTINKKVYSYESKQRIASKDIYIKEEVSRQETQSSHVAIATVVGTAAV